MPGAIPPGYTGGVLASKLDLQAIQSNKVKLQDERVGLMRDTIELQQQMRMMQLMHNFKPGQANSPQDMAGMLDQVATIQMESGQLDKGAATAAKASSIRNQASSIAARRFKMQQTRLQQFANVLGSVPDTPQGYQTALLTMVQTDPNVVRDPKFANLMQTPWRPGLVNQIRGMVISAKDRSLMEYHKSQEALMAENKKVDEMRLKLMGKEKQYLKDRDRALAKQGVKMPSAADISAIADQATRDFPGSDPADIRVRSRMLAEQIPQLVQKEHITPAEAAVKVYQRAKADGEFNGLRKMPTLKGTSAANPLPLPYKSDEEAKADGYKRISENQWYLVNGVPMLALGGHFYTKEELDQADSDNRLLLGNQ